MNGDGKGTGPTVFPARTSLTSVPDGATIGSDKLRTQIDAKRATAREMQDELERVTDELRSAMYIVPSTDSASDCDLPEHPQIKQRALLMIRTALEDAITCLEGEARELEALARDHSS